jgi:anti-anti-sigma factor
LRGPGTLGGVEGPAAPKVIALAGDLDVASVRDVAAELSEAVGDTSRDVVVDLRHVTFMDSTGLGALVQAQKRMRRQGRDLTLRLVPEGPVARMLEVSGMDQAFRIAA